MAKLINDYDFTVIDNEAGLEHLSRRTSRKVDTLLVVSDASVVGLRAAKRITELTRELNIKARKECLIVNRHDKNIDAEKINDLKLDYIGFLPEDTQIQALSLSGDSLMNLKNDNIILGSLRKLGEKIWHCN